MELQSVLKGKKTRLFLIAATIALSVVFVLALVACSSFNDSSFKDADYIEVQSLRFSGENPTAEIKMSSTGVPSTYQLDVEVVPKNATNRALTYYIPSDYHQYVTVNETGLLTAHRISDGINIPVVIRSTTNEKASISATVIVEDVAVTAIRFAEKKINLLYKGADAQIEYSYLPAHAIDGRNATFESQNTDIVTVSSSGLIKPVGVGITHILVKCSTRSNKIIKNQLEVQVSYAEGQYQLQASGNASFNQVMGSYTPIEFSLLILGNNVDPNPKIQWYVDTEPVSEFNDCLQYTHTPDAQTQMSYTIRVLITPYQGKKVELQSDPITVYMAFNGITLTYDNQSTLFDGYRYGDTATFALSSGDVLGTIEKYNWYLADYDDPKNRVWVGETTPSDKDLRRRINVAGDYILTSEGVDSRNDFVSQRTIYFSSEKLVSGDVLVVRPKLLDYGLPPDSYHWYTVSCDENGTYDPDQKRWVADTASDEVLNLPLTSGTFRFIVTASVEGVNASVMREGVKVPFEYVSDVIRVYAPSYEDDDPYGNNLIDVNNREQARFATRSYAAVQSLVIEGIGRTEYGVFLRWNEIEDVPSYQIELKKEDGTIVILDSEEDVARFGANYCYLPRSIVTLDEDFTVRIKQKRSLYSQPFYYGIENERGTGDATHILTFDEKVYPYFETIGYNNVKLEYTNSFAWEMDAPAANGYVTDMTDLQELLSFILLYTPASNTYVKTYANVVKNGSMYNEYKVDLYFAFTYSDETEARYPHGLEEETLASYAEYATYAKMICGATAALPNAFDFTLSFEEAEAEGGVRVVLDVPVSLSGVLKDTTTVKGKASLPVNYDVDRSETVSYSDLPIDLKDGVYADTSNQMVYVMEQGYRPIPNSESLSSLYKLIKGVAVRIVTKEMTDEERALAFFDYIALNTIIDGEIEEERGKATSEYNLYLFEEFRIEGVFLRNKAVDVGIAKAYVVLCSLYGIPCSICSADVDGETYTYNKIFVGGKYYVVDIARSMFVVDGYSVVTHDLFMTSDAEYAEYFTTTEVTPVLYGTSPVAATTYPRTTTVIRTQAMLEQELGKCLEYGDGCYSVELTFSKSIYLDLNTVKEALREISIGGLTLSQNSVLYHSGNSDLRIVTLVTVETISE